VFITRLIQSGLLGDSLDRKYQNEIHANEITLLAYYIANVNIENAYHAALGNTSVYKPFNGICLTDTFQLYASKKEDLLSEDRLKKNTERVEKQKQSKVKVIIGNPPYSVGQKSANDNAQNQSYPYLESRIASTYASKSSATLKNSLYDSYVKAFRWASDRLDQEAGGVIAFVSNAGWLDGNAMDGMRKCLAEEFSKIYVFNLRGNQRTSGELSKREGGKIFGSGSRAPISLTFMIKNPLHQGPAEIYHYDIGDYLTREQKLNIVSEFHDIYSANFLWENITPNNHGDWLNKRSDSFFKLIPLSDKKDKINSNVFFKPMYSRGLATSRDIWCYNFSSINLQNNIKASIDYYNDRVKKASELPQNIKYDINQVIDFDTNKFVWDRQQKKDILNGKSYFFNKSCLYTSLYRPFIKQNSYFNIDLNNCVYLLPQLFPTQTSTNMLICVSGIGVTKDFSTIMTNILPDLELIGKSQCFPRYYYREVSTPKYSLLQTSTSDVDGYIKEDAISEYVFDKCKLLYGLNVTKDDTFYYIYGILHSEDYKQTFSADLKKSLPRLPLIQNKDDFWSFSKAGRELSVIHLNYETIKPCEKVTVTGIENGNFMVDKMHFLNKNDKSSIIYNNYIKISGIPLGAYDYVLNGKSAIEWILERYQVKIDEKTGIKNDPNDWAREHNQPRYILDLILRVITVSLETMRIVRSLPRLDFS
jgi:predicted helicase